MLKSDHPVASRIIRAAGIEDDLRGMSNLWKKERRGVTDDEKETLLSGVVAELVGLSEGHFEGHETFLEEKDHFAAKLTQGEPREQRDAIERFIGVVYLHFVTFLI